MNEPLVGYLSDNVKIDQAIAAQIAGTTMITSGEFDMLGFDSVCIIGTFGTPAANNTLTLQDSNTSGGEVSSSATVGDATKSPLVLDVQHVQGRFIKIAAARGTSSTIDQVTLIRYNARSKPVAVTATVKVAQFNAQ